MWTSAWLTSVVTFLLTSVNCIEPTGSHFGVPAEPATYDYIIIGGGNAGLTLANRLSANTSTLIAVVEAGNFYEITNGNNSQIPAQDTSWTSKALTDVNPLVDWGFNTTPQAGILNEVLHYARGKALGGCTARNYMTYTRSTVDTYDKWASEVGDQGYTYSNFAKYYEKSLNFTPPDNNKRGANATPEYDTSTLGEGGLLALTYSNYAQPWSTWIRKGMQAVGILPINGFTSGALNGSSWLIGTIDHQTGIRESSETAFLEPALARNNLIVYPETLARKILFNGTTAIGVQVQSGNGIPYTLFARKEVIVSAGTFQSPQLLMVSGVGPAAALQEHGIPIVAHRPGVGQNMWDHILFGPSYRVNVLTASNLAYGGNIFKANEEFDTEQDGPLASPGGDFVGYEMVPPSLRQNFTSSALQDLATFPVDWPEIEYLSVAAYFGYQFNYLTTAPIDGYQYATLAAALVAPLSRGNVSIRSADTTDQPLINPNWLTSPTDQQVAVAAYKRARAILQSSPMQPVEIGPEYFPGSNISTDAQILDLVRQSFNSLSHASSTCKMGLANDSMAVLDARARVYGVRNVRVVDASALPFLPPGFPMATVYALAEKIAQDILTGAS